MDWDRVRIFLEVARTGQILGAARRLGVNHATVARQLTSLERELKTKLVERRTTGCVLTSAGAALVAAAEKVAFGSINCLNQQIDRRSAELAAFAVDRRRHHEYHGPGSRRAPSVVIMRIFKDACATARDEQAVSPSNATLMTKRSDFMKTLFSSNIPGQA